MDDLISYLKGLRKAMKVTAIADLLGMPKQTVYEWINRGSLTAFDFDGTIRVDPRILARFLEDHLTTAIPQTLRRAA